MNRKIKFIVEGALIAAAYIGLTMISNLLNLAFGPVQLRISEALTVLPVFTPAAIPGLVLGCFISNIISPMGAVDMIFGTGATLAAAVLTYLLRKICVRGLPVLSFLSPVVLNAVIIGLEIDIFFLPEGAAVWGFVSSAATVGLGELAACFLLGVPLFYAVKRYRIFR